MVAINQIFPFSGKIPPKSGGKCKKLFEIGGDDQ
jgi:hypothetical protein